MLTHTPDTEALELYVVAVDAMQPTWIKLNADTGLPCFTFTCPDGMKLQEAEALKRQADITCGGTLSVQTISRYRTPNPVSVDNIERIKLPSSDALHGTEAWGDDA